MQVIFSLLAGLIIAFAIQLLLGNLGLALGLTVFDIAPHESQNLGQDSQEPETASFLPITHLIGFGVAISLSIVVFVATLLATEFSQIDEPRRGLVFGIILWASFWLLFTWLSSTTIASIADSVLGTVMSGGKQLLSTIRRAMQPSSSDPVNINQTLLELETTTSQLVKFQQQLPELLSQQQETLLAELNDLLQQQLSNGESAPVETHAGQPTSFAESNFRPLETGSIPHLSTSNSSPGLLAQIKLPDWRQVLQQVLRQVDLSHWDVKTLWEQLHAYFSETDRTSAQTVIQQDAEEYVRYAPTWSFRPENLAEEFFDRLYDADAAPVLVQSQLDKLDHTQLARWLQERQDLTEEKVTAIAEQLIEVRDAVRDKISSQLTSQVEHAQTITAVQEKLLAYCRYTNRDLLTPQNLAEKIHALSVEHKSFKRAVSVTDIQSNIAAIEAVLSRRRGLSSSKKRELIETLHIAWPATVTEDHNPTLLGILNQTLTDYFQTNNEATPSLEDIKPVLLDLLSQHSWQSSLSHLDWNDFSSHIQVPRKLQPALSEWLQEIRPSIVQPPRRWVNRALHSTQDLAHWLTTQISRYLRYQDREAFQPTQIAKDLAHIGKGIFLSSVLHWQRRFAEGARPNDESLSEILQLESLLDSDLWQQELAKRRDLTPSEIQQVLDWCQAAWKQAIQQIYTGVQTLWSTSGEMLSLEDGNPLKAAGQQVVEQIEDAQQTLQSHAIAIKAEILQPVNAARKQVAIAAWWLFNSLIWSGMAAALAGWGAVLY